MPEGVTFGVCCPGACENENSNNTNASERDWFDFMLLMVFVVIAHTHNRRRASGISLEGGKHPGDPERVCSWVLTIAGNGTGDLKNVGKTKPFDPNPIMKPDDLQNSSGTERILRPDESCCNRNKRPV